MIGQQFEKGVVLEITFEIILQKHRYIIIKVVMPCLHFPYVAVTVSQSFFVMICDDDDAVGAVQTPAAV